MRFLRQSLMGLFLAATTLGLIAYAVQIVREAVQERLANERSAPPPRERVFAVGVVTAELGMETPQLDAFGEVQSRRTLELRAAAGGRVIWLSDQFQDGGAVSAGDVLLRIDPADAQAALERAQVDVMDAEAELADASRTMGLAEEDTAAAVEQAGLQERAYQRQVDLSERGVGTAAAVEVAELAAAAARQAVLSRRQAQAAAAARIDLARTQVARARIALAEAERRLTDTTLTAPFDGTLAETNVAEGRLVAANEQLAELVDADALEVSFRVSTAQYTRLLDQNGRLIRAPVSVTLDVSGVDLTVTGQIRRSSVEAGEGQTGRLIFARLDETRGVRPGDFVTVTAQEPMIDNVARLPASAYDPAGSVLVLGEEDRLERLPVTLVRRQGNDVLVRGDGLQGRQVVEALSPLLGEGIKVRPLTMESAPEEPQYLTLSQERRARLVAFVEGNVRMPQDVKARVLARLSEPQVPAQMVARLESRMGG